MMTTTKIMITIITIIIMIIIIELFTERGPLSFVSTTEELLERKK
jgi:hypothetical protein